MALYGLFINIFQFIGEPIDYVIRFRTLNIKFVCCYNRTLTLVIKLHLEAMDFVTSIHKNPVTRK